MSAVDFLYCTCGCGSVFPAQCRGSAPRTLGVFNATSYTVADPALELIEPAALAHLERGARIARELLAHKDTELGLTSSEREWLEAERTRKAAT